MGARSNMNTVMQYQQTRALQKQLALMEDKAGLPEEQRQSASKPSRVRAFFDWLLGA